MTTRSAATAERVSAPARRLGVLGWPVAHSRSPAMQNAALAAAGLPDWRYSLLPVPPDLFPEIVPVLPAAGFAGVNVTIPHKAAALALAASASERARRIGAANTLTFDGTGAAHADNTDAPALTDALAAIGVAVPASALVLGAGGSARAAAWALRAIGVARVRIWNRTPERARMLAGDLGLEAAAEITPAELLVNCTAVGLHGEDPFSVLPLSERTLGRCEGVADYVYARGGTALSRAAAARGIPLVDGLELLVRQGALAFSAFTGRPAPLEVMRDAARAAG